MASVLAVTGCAQAPDVADTAATQGQPAVPTISQETLLHRLAAGDASMVVIDVRSAQEFAAGHVPGAINVPHDTISAHLDELRAAQDKDIVLYCESGRRAGMATQTLQDNGFSRLLHLDGHMQQWRAREQAQ